MIGTGFHYASELDGVMAVQHCQYTKCYWAVQFKMVKMVNLIYEFYHKKKKWVDNHYLFRDLEAPGGPRISLLNHLEKNLNNNKIGVLL